MGTSNFKNLCSFWVVFKLPLKYMISDSAAILENINCIYFNKVCNFSLSYLKQKQKLLLNGTSVIFCKWIVLETEKCTLHSNYGYIFIDIAHFIWDADPVFFLTTSSETSLHYGLNPVVSVWWNITKFLKRFGVGGWFYLQVGIGIFENQVLPIIRNS